MEAMGISSRMKFLIRSALKGLGWMIILIALYLLFREFIFEQNPDFWIKRFYSRPLVIYGIYLASEFIFGLFPPELFMLWAINKGNAAGYFINLTFFAGASYGIGYINFLIGRFLHRILYFRYVRKKFFAQYWPLLHKYGAFLIIVAAMTPVPFGAVSILVGSANYSSAKYLRFAIFRIVRFAIYGYIVFQTHQF